MESFSFSDRFGIKENLAKNEYDLIIIGGGITGAGIALDAASRGLSVALVEKNDFASGTSSKSTKLIHGGLRYLKQFHFKMVAEVGRERKIVHNIAPHLVLPEKMLLPIVKGGSLGKFGISLGLKFYDMLANVKGDDQRQMLTKSKTLKTEPLLPSEKITGAGLYAEYRTDDARLTIEIIKTAYTHGADILNYVEAEDFIYEDGKVKGLECFDHLTEENFAVHGKYVVNAAGPWVDDLRKKNNSKKGKHLHITKGIHLVFPREKLPVQQSMYFEIEDGRMLFVIPRDHATYIGTTDTDYTGHKDDLHVSSKDALYLITSINNMLPTVNISLKDVQSSWAGLRPLISEEGKSASEISRKDEIFISDSGLISIAGGKLTGYRKMAEKVVDMVSKKLNKGKFNKCKTISIPLVGNKFESYDHVLKYLEEVKIKLINNNISNDYASYLVHNYGIQTEIILADFIKQRGENPDEKLLWSELYFGIDHEMVCKPLDFLERRTGRLYFNINSILNHTSELLEFFKEKFFWSEDVYLTESDRLEKAFYNSRNFE